jgi:hypothetical protein
VNSEKIIQKRFGGELGGLDENPKSKIIKIQQNY